MSEHSRQILRKIHEAEEAVKLSKENVNRILEIVSTLSSHLCVEDTKDSQSNFEISLRCIQALRMLFLKFFHEGDLDVSSHGRLSTTASEEEESTPQKVFRNWLGKQWVKFLNLLTKGILGEDSRISLYCFRTAMKIVVLELEHITRAKITSDSVDVETWNTTLAETLGDGYFHNVISAVFSSSNSDDSLMKELLNGWISEYADIKYWVLRVVKSILMDQSLEKTGSLENNIFEILLAYDIEVENSKFYSSMAVDPFKTTQTGKRKRDESSLHACKFKFQQPSEYRKILSESWIKLLNPCDGHKLPLNLYKKFLMRIEDAVFPNLTTPLILSDFLTDLYETGGIISLLSLNGLFYLIQNHNFDYPNFYDKLYRLLTPSIFHTKYRSKFFSLISLFLNSPHLPAYLVAAFMKKISRLCLSAPPHGCIFSIRLIFNLMRRNPPCRILIDRTSKSKTDIAGIDPFDMDEPNPSKSNALESSLWEMKSLLSHYCPDVAKEAQDLLTTEIWPLVDEDLSTVINLTFKDIFEEYLSVKPKNITFNYKKPAVLFEDTETLFSFR